MPTRKRKTPSSAAAVVTAVASETPEPEATKEATTRVKAAKKRTAKTSAPAIESSNSARTAVGRPRPSTGGGLVWAVVRNAQNNEAFHPKYIKELQHIYAKLGHDTFAHGYLRALQNLMVHEEAHPYATLGLRCLAKYATSYNTEDTHPILVFTFDWLLDTVSPLPIVRFRLCQFVNLLLDSLSNDAALDDSICDQILKYMLERMKDVSTTVRVQALTAMQRLQSPDNPNDPVVKIYQYHLNADPSPLVRMAVISAIGRNMHTVPFILDRFWDADDRVRKHVYLHMCSYSVRSYKVVQRLQFIEQGLTDPCAAVRTIVTNVLLPAWLQTYGNDYIKFVAALKLDASEEDIERFRKAARLVLMAIFRKRPVDELVAAVPLHAPGTELEKCIPIDRLTVESSLYWLTLIEFLDGGDANEGGADGGAGGGGGGAGTFGATNRRRSARQRAAQNGDDDDSDDENNDEDGGTGLDRILPELSVYCAYVSRYFADANPFQMDKWQKLEHHYILLSLCEIMVHFDFCDEIGRNNLRRLLCEMLTTQEFDDTIVAKIVLCLERVVPVADERLQLVADIITTVVDANSATCDQLLESERVKELLRGDANLNVLVSTIKLRLMDLEDQERRAMQQKDFAGAEAVRESIAACGDELSALIGKHLRGGADGANGDGEIRARRVSNQETMRCIQMAYNVVRTPTVRSLNPAIVKVFKDFVRRQMESKQMHIRDSALKCGISFAMLYEQLAKDVYTQLFTQYFQHQNQRIWATAISGMFEMIDLYGFEYFEEEAGGSAASENGEANVSTSANRRLLKNNTRQLYSSELDAQQDGDDGDGVDGDQLMMRRRNSEIMHVFDHILEKTDEPEIQQVLIDGYCRLLLRSHISGANYVSRMLIKYFNPATDPEITQMLGIFFEKLVQHHQQECLQEALFMTLFTVLESPMDSPLQEIAPEAILTFVITSTQPASCSPGLNVHNTMAVSFLTAMSENRDNKELMRLLAKSFVQLEVSVDDAVLVGDLLSGIDALLAGGTSGPAGPVQAKTGDGGEGGDGDDAGGDEVEVRVDGEAPRQLEARMVTYLKAFREKLMLAAAKEANGVSGTFNSLANEVAKETTEDVVGVEEDEEHVADEDAEDNAKEDAEEDAKEDDEKVEEKAADEVAGSSDKYTEDKTAVSGGSPNESASSVVSNNEQPPQQRSSRTRPKAVAETPIQDAAVAVVPQQQLSTPSIGVGGSRMSNRLAASTPSTPSTTATRSSTSRRSSTRRMSSSTIIEHDEQPDQANDKTANNISNISNRSAGNRSMSKRKPTQQENKQISTNDGSTSQAAILITTQRTTRRQRAAIEAADESLNNSAAVKIVQVASKAAPSTPAVRSSAKRRNDMLTKSPPSPRLAEQMSKKSRTSLVLNASPNIASPTNRRMSSRRSVDRVRAVSVLLTPNSTTEVNKRIAVEASKASKMDRMKVSVVLTPNSTSEVNKRMAAAAVPSTASKLSQQQKAWDNLATSEAPATVSSSSISLTPLRLRRRTIQSVTNSPVSNAKQNASPTVTTTPAKATHRPIASENTPTTTASRPSSNRSAPKSANHPKQLASAASSSDDSNINTDSQTKTAADVSPSASTTKSNVAQSRSMLPVRSNIPVRNVNSTYKRPVNATPASKSSAISSRLHKPTTSSTTSSSAQIKYPNVKVHRLGQPRTHIVSGSASTAAAVAAARLRTTTTTNATTRVINTKTTVGQLPIRARLAAAAATTATITKMPATSTSASIAAQVSARRERSVGTIGGVRLRTQTPKAAASTATATAAASSPLRSSNRGAVASNATATATRPTAKVATRIATVPTTRRLATVQPNNKNRVMRQPFGINATDAMKSTRQKL